MKRAKYKKNRKLVPHTLEYSGEYSQVPISMQLFIYTQDTVQEYNDLSLIEIEQVLDQAPKDAVKWFNLHGLHDIELLQQIGKYFEIEGYVMAEILNFSRRTRVEELEQALFFSVKALLVKEHNAQVVDIEQISFILKRDVLLSFQEKKGNFFHSIRERIRTKMGLLRKRDSSYLLYGLIDSLMDTFLNSLDDVEDQVEAILVQAKSKYNRNTLITIEEYTQELQEVKRAITPFREVLTNLKTYHERQDAECLIPQNNMLFFDRLHYKCNEMLDQVEYNLGKLDSATNYFFASQSNRMNEIMKVLTIVSVIFIPLTFIVGVYGMNFENMPELKDPHGYMYTMLGMCVLVLVMVMYFKWKKWF